MKKKFTLKKADQLTDAEMREIAGGAMGGFPPGCLCYGTRCSCGKSTCMTDRIKEKDNVPRPNGAICYIGVGYMFSEGYCMDGQCMAATTHAPMPEVPTSTAPPYPH